MSGKFEHDEAFPVIARLIEVTFRATGDFVRHDQLIAAILNDAAANALVDAARGTDEKSRRWWASNMKQWFSQRITVEASDYQSLFDRKRIKGAWAYKPIA